MVEDDGDFAAVADAVLRRKRHPVYTFGQGVGAIGLNGDALARHGLEVLDKSLVNPHRGLATG